MLNKKYWFVQSYYDEDDNSGEGTSFVSDIKLVTVEFLKVSDERINFFIVRDVFGKFYKCELSDLVCYNTNPTLEMCMISVESSCPESIEVAFSSDLYEEIENLKKEDCLDELKNDDIEKMNKCNEEIRKSLEKEDEEKIAEVLKDEEKIQQKIDESTEKIKKELVDKNIPSVLGEDDQRNNEVKKSKEMSLQEKILKIKVGDEVFSEHKGWHAVMEIIESPDYPIRCKGAACYYTERGRYYLDGASSSRDISGVKFN